MPRRGGVGMIEAWPRTNCLAVRVATLRLAHAGAAARHHHPWPQPAPQSHAIHRQPPAVSIKPSMFRRSKTKRAESRPIVHVECMQPATSPPGTNRLPHRNEPSCSAIKPVGLRRTADPLFAGPWVSQGLSREGAKRLFQIGNARSVNTVR